MEEEQGLTKKERRLRRREQKSEEQKREERGRLKKKIVFWLSAALLLSAIIWALIRFGGNSSQILPLVDKVSAGDWVKGERSAKVVLIEYSDFQCPACRIYYPIIKELTDEFKDKAAFIYRHFPLRQIHFNAELAARAAEAAGKQDKFWEMHDLIFDKQSEWAEEKDARELFIKYAGELNLDTEKFRRDLVSAEVKEKAQNDYLSGLRASVNATPTFFLNGQKLQNPRSFDEFKNQINQALNL